MARATPAIALVRARREHPGTHGEPLMPQNAWSPKRERQYEHIKESELDQGRSEDRAEEIAARTVNKERAEAGETKAARAAKPKRSR
jgi:hypothetical protein